MPTDVIMRFACNIIMWVWHISRMHIKNLHTTYAYGLCALNLDVAIGWEAGGMILDCCRCFCGVPCTKVLHSFNEVQIFVMDVLMYTIAHIIITELLYI